MATDRLLDPDIAYRLEMSEALAYQDTYTAAASMPGNPTGATTAPIGGAAAWGLTAIDFGFFNRVVGLGTARPAAEADVETASQFFLDLGVTQSIIHAAPGAEPAELVPWMQALGYVEGARWVKLWRRLDDLPTHSSSMRIERIDERSYSIWLVEAETEKVFTDCADTVNTCVSPALRERRSTIGVPGFAADSNNRIEPCTPFE